MFGESESESPRVPSPWDSLISNSSPTTPSPVPNSPSPLIPKSLGAHLRTPSPLAAELIPRLVPESDDGNVEYKLQLLNPSPARFARLVTQLKWRLLEGGGQAYYELGVADSGDLVGLPRADLEQTLETLEMMAGEIGASVIVVKEVEVPAVLARLAKRSGDRRRGHGTSAFLGIGGGSGGEDDDEGDESGSYSSSSAFNTETEGSSQHSASDVDEGADDLSSTIVLNRGSNESSMTSLQTMFSMDAESDAVGGENGYSADTLPVGAPKFSIDLEISSVFKPRPVRTRVHQGHLLLGATGKAKRTKKPKHFGNGDDVKDPEKKTQNRKQTRDRKREEKRKALLTKVAQSVDEKDEQEPVVPISAPVPVPAAAISEAEVLVSSLAQDLVSSLATATLHDSEEEVPEITVLCEDSFENNDDDDDDVFGLPSTTKRSFPTFSPTTTGESHLDVDPAAVKLAAVIGSPSSGDHDEPRLIVEALVVRKMSLEEGFLDFGGFSIL